MAARDHDEAPSLRFRGDIEGLRALAVLLVVLDHLDVPGFHGGFIGVDIFFVISGYLITSLLAAELAQKRTVSITGFYWRRARRILPAAVTVIVAVVLTARLLLNDLRVAQVQHDALWALCFGSNINEIGKATDYFAQGLAASPFQHYWSLAVEEQFYLVWPALFLLVASWRVGVRASWRTRVTVTIALVGAASFAWSIVATSREPAAAYFSTSTRAWELAAGALLGVATTVGTSIPRRVAAFASFGAVALLVIGCARIDGSTPFPGAAAILPVGAAILFILGGMTGSLALPQRALGLSPVRFVGRISYSIYLWHWPLIVFAAALFPVAMKDVGPRVLLFALVLGVATFSFYLVEQPGRRISLSRSGRVGRLALGAGALVVLVVGSLTVVSAEARSAGAGGSSGVGPAAPIGIAETGVVDYAGGHARRSDTVYRAALRAWQQRLLAGLEVQKLPAALHPLPDHIVHNEPRCTAGVATGECVVGDPGAPRVAVLFGDSHAGMFEPTLAAALGSSAWRIHVFTLGFCGWAGTVEPNANIPASECAAAQRTALARIRGLHPDAIMLSQDNAVEPGRSETEIGDALAMLARLADRVVVLGHTPETPSFDRCLSGSDDISRCIADVPPSYTAESEAVSTLAGRHRVSYVDTSRWFCVAFEGGSLRCPAIVGQTPVWRDGDHVTDRMANELVPLLRASLGAAGIPSCP